MFVMVFVEHILWGGNCIQRQKNTGMIGVSFSKSVSKVRINVWDGSCKTHFWTPRKWSRHFLPISSHKMCEASAEHILWH